MFPLLPSFLYTVLITTFQLLHQADFTIPVEIEGNYHNVYVIKRPGVDEFMKRVGELYEVVVFTASVSKVCQPHNLPNCSSILLFFGTDQPAIVRRPSPGPT